MWKRTNITYLRKQFCLIMVSHGEVSSSNLHWLLSGALSDDLTSVFFSSCDSVVADSLEFNQANRVSLRVWLGKRNCSVRGFHCQPHLCFLRYKTEMMTVAFSCYWKNRMKNSHSPVCCLSWAINKLSSFSNSSSLSPALCHQEAK